MSISFRIITGNVKSAICDKCGNKVQHFFTRVCQSCFKRGLDGKRISDFHLRHCVLGSWQDNYTVFKTMVRMGRINNEHPAVIDRLLWLIGSGKYVGENEKITRQKAAFIQDILPKLDLI